MDLPTKHAETATREMIDPEEAHLTPEQRELLRSLERSLEHRSVANTDLSGSSWKNCGWNAKQKTMRVVTGSEFERMINRLCRRFRPVDSEHPAARCRT